MSYNDIKSKCILQKSQSISSEYEKSEFELAEENWKGKNTVKKGKKLKVGIYKQSLHDIQKNRNKQFFFLKNGNFILKPINISNSNCIFKNTCPFDIMFQILETTLCDSVNFENSLNTNKYVFLNDGDNIIELLKLISQKGKEGEIYLQRRKLLYNLFKVRSQLLAILQKLVVSAM